MQENNQNQKNTYSEQEQIAWQKFALPTTTLSQVVGGFLDSFPRLTRKAVLNALNRTSRILSFNQLTSRNFRWDLVTGKDVELLQETMTRWELTTSVRSKLMTGLRGIFKQLLAENHITPQQYLAVLDASSVEKQSHSKQQTNYEIIKDEALLRDFIAWLPELQSGECFYVSLLARSKYLADKSLLRRDRCSLKRFTANSKERLLEKIRHLEIPVGAYRQNDVPIPQEALALYITPNPRSLITATKASLVKFAELITSPYNGYDPQSEAMSEIQKACSRKVYFDFDFDGVNANDFLAEISGKINFDAVHIVQTKGGFHCLIELSKVEKQFERSWYKTIKAIPGCDITSDHLLDDNEKSRGDRLLNVPGCVQSTFVPHFLKF